MPMIDDLDLNKWQKRLSSRLAALGDWKQRVILFARSISDLNPGAASSALETILTQVFCKRDRPSRLTAESAVLALAMDHWPKDHRSTVLKCAQENNERLTCLFVGEINTSLSVEDEHNYPVPSYFTDRPLTLGERRSIASRPNHRLIKMAIRDPHPMVIAKLMDNPRLTENDVVFISTRRPVPPGVLVEVAMHPRFRTSSRVARALVNNPALPSGIALTLLPSLDAAYFNNLATEDRFHPLIREAAREILALRKK
ncbi:MAG: hypothetical protein GY847_41310 [Proteobacteria bacterium]|nr:hypothetical protein [Pseudomonadota bacterium]